MYNNRVIKFRALSADQGRVWCYGFYTEEDRKGYIRNEKGFVIRVEPNTVGQFTGLTDKVGNEIYEDDIVYSCTTTSGMKIQWVVVWHNGAWRVKDPETNKKVPYITSKYFWKSIEVIGNIHQHKHLLTT